MSKKKILVVGGLATATIVAGSASASAILINKRTTDSNNSEIAEVIKKDIADKAQKTSDTTTTSEISETKAEDVVVNLETGTTEETNDTSAETSTVVTKTNSDFYTTNNNRKIAIDNSNLVLSSFIESFLDIKTVAEQLQELATLSDLWTNIVKQASSLENLSLKVGEENDSLVVVFTSTFNNSNEETTLFATGFSLISKETTTNNSITQTDTNSNTTDKTNESQSSTDEGNESATSNEVSSSENTNDSEVVNSESETTNDLSTSSTDTETSETLTTDTESKTDEEEAKLEAQKEAQKEADLLVLNQINDKISKLVFRTLKTTELAQDAYTYINLNATNSSNSRSVLAEYISVPTLFNSVQIEKVNALSYDQNGTRVLFDVLVKLNDAELNIQFYVTNFYNLENDLLKQFNSYNDDLSKIILEANNTITASEFNELMDGFSIKKLIRNFKNYTSDASSISNLESIVNQFSNDENLNSRVAYTLEYNAAKTESDSGWFTLNILYQGSEKSSSIKLIISGFKSENADALKQAANEAQENQEAEKIANQNKVNEIVLTKQKEDALFKQLSANIIYQINLNQSLGFAQYNEIFKNLTPNQLVKTLSEYVVNSELKEALNNELLQVSKALIKYNPYAKTDREILTIDLVLLVGSQTFERSVNLYTNFTLSEINGLTLDYTNYDGEQFISDYFSSSGVIKNIKDLLRNSNQSNSLLSNMFLNQEFKAISVNYVNDSTKNLMKVYAQTNEDNFYTFYLNLKASDVPLKQIYELHNLEMALKQLSWSNYVVSWVTNDLVDNVNNQINNNNDYFNHTFYGDGIFPVNYSQSYYNEEGTARTNLFFGANRGNVRYVKSNRAAKINIYVDLYKLNEYGNKISVYKTVQLQFPNMTWFI